MRPPRLPTVRVRLTVLYGGLFLATGAVLLMIMYLLEKSTIDGRTQAMVVDKQTLRSLSGGTPTGDPMLRPVPERLVQSAAEIRADTLEHLLLMSIVSIVVLAVVGIAVGWWLTGRVLLPIRHITATARRLSWQDLHERIALDGPPGELKALADTFDGMLARLEDAFASQHGFMSSVSHELRTPLAIQRAAIEIGLADPAPDSVARVREELLAANRRSEHLIDGLLMLARSERGLTTREPVALDARAEEAIALHARAAAERRVTVVADLRSTSVTGDGMLLTQLIANLVHNAIRYNRPDGRVEVEVGPDVGVRVSNTGPAVAADLVTEAFEPFRRLDAPRDDDSGAGLGLSIVRSIAKAHGLSVDARPRTGGGLVVRLRLDEVAAPVP